MSRLARLLLGLALAVLGASCASVRTTGPKTAFDRCVDDCDNALPHCSFPTAGSCQVEYDACVASCDRRDEARLR